MELATTFCIVFEKNAGGGGHNGKLFPYCRLDLVWHQYPARSHAVVGHKNVELSCRCERRCRSRKFSELIESQRAAGRDLTPDGTVALVA
jgi:hypothetical protein